MINLRYPLKDGKECWDESNRTEINRLDLKDFVERNGYLFLGRRTLDLGCGDAYLRERRDLGYSSYTGLDDKDKHNPEVLGDFNSLLFQDESFDLILLLQPGLQRLPNFDGIRRVLSSGGYFVLQIGRVMLEKYDMLSRVAKCFGSMKEITDYLITIERPDGETDRTLENVFVVAQK